MALRQGTIACGTYIIMGSICGTDEFGEARWRIASKRVRRINAAMCQCAEMVRVLKLAGFEVLHFQDGPD
jgi:hypothetical protein